MTFILPEKRNVSMAPRNGIITDHLSAECSGQEKDSACQTATRRQSGKSVGRHKKHAVAESEALRNGNYTFT
jgi:hypothetical protein